MQPDVQLIWQLFRGKVERARKMSGEAKVLEGLQLFERSCRMMGDSVRSHFPEASEEDVDCIVRELLKLRRQIENRTTVLNVPNE